MFIITPPTSYPAGRCSVMSDLRVITFDGNNVALYDNGSYILVQLPRETIIGTVEKCPASQVTSEGWGPSLGPLSGVPPSDVRSTTELVWEQTGRLSAPLGKG